MKDLQYYIECFSSLNVNRSGGFPSPHKPVMLLAVMALAEGGMLPEKKIWYEPELLEIYRSYFEAVKRPGDACNPYFPFFHLQRESFWHLQAKKGREQALQAMATARGNYYITENIDYAYLDPELFALINSQHARAVLRQSIIDFWFPQEKDTLKAIVLNEKAIVSYQRTLEDGLCIPRRDKGSVPDEKVRDPAFARIVKRAYDYRCAASGWRVILHDGAAMVQAAHLIPYAESQDDDPRNGIALSPTYHWALDKHIVAPGPDLKWHVSTALDKRNRDYLELRDIDKQRILLPSKKNISPEKTAWNIAWTIWLECNILAG